MPISEITAVANPKPGSEICEAPVALLPLDVVLLETGGVELVLELELVEVLVGGGGGGFVCDTGTDDKLTLNVGIIWDGYHDSRVI